MATIRCEEFESVVIVYFNDTMLIDETKIEQIKTELITAVRNAKAGKVLLNFLNVKAMSSSMFGKLHLVKNECKNRQVNLKLCNVRDDVLEVFKTLGFHKLFAIYEDETKALAAFKKKGWFW